MDKLAIFGGRPIQSKKKWESSPFGKEELRAVQRVMKKGILSQFRGGDEVRNFERQFAYYMNTKYAIAVTSGTTALHTALAAFSFQKGSEILVPALTFVSTASVVLQEKLVPVFVDIDDTFCIDSDDLERKITKKTKAIIPVHLFGYPANMPLIKKIARKNNLFIIEDACQAPGAMIRGKKAGSFGDFGCFSFFQTKNMSCGEGGMVITSNKKLYEAARLKREHGSPPNSLSWYTYKTLGYNYNMTELQAAIGLEQLKKLDQLNKKRIANARKYKESLKNSGLVFIKRKPHFTNVFHNFPVLLPKIFSSRRDFFVKALQAEGVPVGITYPCPLYKTELFRKKGINGNCPKTEDISSRIFNLFTNPTIYSSVIKDIPKAVKKVLSYVCKNEKYK